MKPAPGPDLLKTQAGYFKAVGAVLAVMAALVCPMASYLMMPSYQATVFRQRIERVQRDSYFGAL